MSILGKRVDRLEEATKEIRLRAYVVELAEERGLDVARLIADWQDIRARTAAMRARGMTVNEILAAAAERLGISVDELRVRCQELVERFSL